MSTLRHRPNKDHPEGCLHNLTPADAGWTYVGFQVHSLKSGDRLSDETGDFEVCLVIISGKARIQADGQDFGVIGERISPFEGGPHSVYIPGDATYSIEAQTALEIAVCQAPGDRTHPARHIPPEQATYSQRGFGTNVRHVRDILPETEPACSLLVVEVITPSGNWSSYPSHKHDTDNLPDESLLEEVYYHRFYPPQGFGFQRVYTDDRSLDEAMVIEDRDLTCVPKGYHPCGAAHGYDLYYLNVMAGPRRIWRFNTEPEHRWLLSWRAADQPRG